MIDLTVDSKDEFFNVIEITAKSLSDEEIVTIVSVLINWGIARRWAYKIVWDTDFKVAEKKIAKNYKSWGLLLKSIYKLCVVTNDLQDRYTKANVWFNNICIDLIMLDILAAFNPPEISNRNLKKSVLDEKRKISQTLQDLEEYKNPFSEYKALGLLFDTSFYMINNFKNDFHRECWSPFLKNYSGYIRELSSKDWGRGFMENGKVFCRLGNGCQKSNLFYLGTVETYKEIFEKFITFGFLF